MRRNGLRVTIELNHPWSLTIVYVVFSSTAHYLERVAAAGPGRGIHGGAGYW
jgi:hypothetical protein